VTGPDVTGPDVTGPDVTGPARTVLAVAALAAAVVTWAALPMSGARAGARPALVAAVACAVLTVVQLAAALLTSRPGTARRDSAVYQAAIPGLAQRAWDGVSAIPWPQGLIVAVLGLEALHPARPWHTAVLGVVVLAFLLALHLAENAAGPGVLRPHLPLMAAGIGLAAVSAGAAMLPAASSAWLTVVAAAAALVVAALTLPV